MTERPAAPAMETGRFQWIREADRVGIRLPEYPEAVRYWSRDYLYSLEPSVAFQEIEDWCQSVLDHVDAVQP